jgi:Ca2+-transporting ATPase
MADSAQTTRINGLTEAEAHTLRVRDGYNELPSDGSRGFLSIAREVLTEPMLFLLLACGGIYLVVGDRAEAILLVGFVSFVVIITFIQRYKAEKALDALKGLSSPRALVIRDGVKHKIPARDLVVGDVIVVEEGDRIPADAAVISSRDCTVNESILTGESVAVTKTAGGDHGAPKPGGDGNGYLFANTLVVRGNAIARVTATGTKTQVGSIGAMLKSIPGKRTRLERDVAALVGKTAVLGILVCFVAAFLVLISGGSAVRSLLTGLSLAMSLLPEELPVVLTIFLALGAIRLSKLSVLTRRMPVIETLGSATVLCVDKTGTLTENRMRLAAVDDGQERLTFTQPPDPDTNASLYRLLSVAALACDAQTMDPIDTAVQAVATGSRTMHRERTAYTFEGNVGIPVPFVRAFLYESETGDRIVAMKGAPESLAKLCRLEGDELDSVIRRTGDLAADGYRVLGVARADIPAGGVFDVDRQRFSFSGLLAFADPIRPETVRAVEECRSAGIRVVIVTGDYPATACHVARQVGLVSPDTVVTGDMLEAMTEDELADAVGTINVFARVVPAQKLKLIDALKKHHHVVGMTGDGVNDAPALKSAHIGIAMGEHGTDVARESASLVLLHDDFSSIVAAVRQGRRIYDNIRKAASYILAIHVPIAGLALLPSLIGAPMVLLPAHIALLELLIDPACSIVFEAEDEEDDIMVRPPRPVGEPLFDRVNLTLRLLQGGFATLAVSAVVVVAVRLGWSEEALRSASFLSLVSANLALIVSNLAWGERGTLRALWDNIALRYLVTGIAVVIGALYAVPVGRGLFHVAPLSPVAIGIAAAVFATVYAASELIERYETNIPAGRKIRSGIA